MLLPALVLLPDVSRPHGTYTSQPVWVPREAGYAQCTLSGRGQWGRLGARQTVIELALEINVDGTWRPLGGCTTDAMPARDRRGHLAESTSLRVRLPRQRVPAPQVRAVLQCHSQCPGALTLEFDTAQPPAVASQAHHSVTYDSDNEAVAAVATSVTIGSFTVANNANRAMVVGVACWSAVAGDGVVSSVNHNGSTTGWASVITRVDGSNDRASLWRKVTPAAVSATVVVTMTGTCGELGANALSVWDVDQTTPIAGATGADGTAAPLTVTVSAATGDLVYDVAYHYGTPTSYTLTVGASQTARANVDIIDYETQSARLAASTEPGAATVTMSWTNGTGTTTNWCQVACAIKAAAAGKVTKNTRAYPLGLQRGYAQRQGMTR